MLPVFLTDNDRALAYSGCCKWDYKLHTFFPSGQQVIKKWSPISRELVPKESPWCHQMIPMLPKVFTKQSPSDKINFFRAELLPEGIRVEYFCTQIYFIVWTWKYIHFFNELLYGIHSSIKCGCILFLCVRKITFPRKYLVILVTLKLQTYLKIQNLKEKKVGLKMTPPRPFELFQKFIHFCDTICPLSKQICLDYWVFEFPDFFSPKKPIYYYNTGLMHSPPFIYNDLKTMEHKLINKSMFKVILWSSEIKFFSSLRSGFWPLLHSMADRVIFDEEHWNSYRRVEHRLDT